jgi:ComF family protein
MNGKYIKLLYDKFRRALFYIREFFFPCGCPLCGTSLIDADESWQGLCASCGAALEKEFTERLVEDNCGSCGKPLISEIARCLSCLNGTAFSFDRAMVLFPYMGKYRRLLASYKFKKNIARGKYLAEKIQRICTSGIFPDGAVIVPVPPRPGKIRKTGWDQVEYLVGLLEKNYGTAVSRCLKRLPSQSQKELSRENRKTNLKGHILPVRKAPETALLIDDVMTTGSTLDACAAALKDSGARSVYALCLFYD